MTAPRNIYATARTLARPVVRGQLPLTHAHAALIVETLHQERTGALAGLRPPDVVGLKRFLLGQEIERQETERDVAEWRIKRLVGPMIAGRQPSNAVLAEAHGLNGLAGFPLTEHEVTSIVRREIYYALPPAPSAGGRRYAG
ncbi:MAG TPA: hypothetical protein VGI53_07415 [Dyella sp.]|jgi:hypothetical protein